MKAVCCFKVDIYFIKWMICNTYIKKYELEFSWTALQIRQSKFYWLTFFEAFKSRYRIQNVKILYYEKTDFKTSKKYFWSFWSRYCLLFFLFYNFYFHYAPSILPWSYKFFNNYSVLTSSLQIDTFLSATWIDKYQRQILK